MATQGEISRREQSILEQLLRTGSITVEEIVAKFNVSVATARRDLEALEKRSRLRRTHGGAISLEPLLYEPFRHVSSYQEQVERCADEKRRIALAAAELINEGDTIALTPGTTTTQITRSIPPHKKITVVTNTVNVAMELSNRSGVNVFVTGGFLHGGWFSLVGEAATDALRRIFVDKVFIGANGVHAEHGVTAYHPDEAALNSVMVRQAKQKIVVADHSKLGVVATHVFCLSSDINLLITDTGATDDAVAGLVAKGVEIRRV
ncbi:MAG: DeoR/GlpR family DNA-binding transcription regulator [Terriglobia bacterium]